MTRTKKVPVKVLRDIAVGLVASANNAYVQNPQIEIEVKDVYDVPVSLLNHHPEKSERTFIHTELTISLSLTKLIVLLISLAGLGLGALVSRLLSWAPALMASVSWNLNKIL